MGLARRLLLLEDDQALRDLLIETLAEEGFRVTLVETFGALVAAADVAEVERPSVVVADFWGTSHRALSPTDRAEIRRLAALVPVVLLTGRTWAERADVADLGVAALVRKPFDVEHLLQTVRRVAAGASQ